MKTKKNWSCIKEVHVQYFDGKAQDFPSLVNAIRSVGWNKIKACTGRPIGYLSDFSYSVYQRVYWCGGDPVVFRDEMGLVIPVWLIQEVARSERLHYYPNHWGRWGLRRKNLVYVFRDGPVPSIRHSRSRRGGDRYMKTTQEIRESDFLDNYDEDAAEFGVTVRRSRSRRGLPTVWDDLPSSRQANKNWKRYRHHQWR